MSLVTPLPALEVELTVAGQFGLAHEQNAIPLVSAVTLLQRGEAPLTDASLELALDGFGEPRSFPLPTLLPGERLQLEALDFALPTGLLKAVRETERTALRWRLRHGEQALAGGDRPVEVLPFNHWGGDPRLLAAYVMPNDQRLAPVLSAVAERLKALTGRADLDGYQANDPGRVAMMLRACYQVLQAEGLRYLDAPASFDRGQKIRLPASLLDEKQGCCLDVAVLVASLLEAMGLSPFLIALDGHAFAGLWLVPGEFCEGVVDDAARLRNEIALGHLLAVDSSAMVCDPGAPFDEGVAVADRHLADDQRFAFGLDLKMARRARIRPLSLRESGPAAPDEQTADLGALAQGPTVVVVGGQAPAATRPAVPDEVRRRFERWQGNLLDLTFRNRLLSFQPEGKSGVLLDIPDLAVFEDLIALQRAFRILPAPDALEIPGRSVPLMTRRGLDAQYLAHLQQQLAEGSVLTGLGGAALTRLLKAVNYQARTAYEEGGAHALYLAMGVLAYYENAAAKEPRYAPLLLYPVTLAYDRASGLFGVRRTADDPLPNVTLIEKLATADFEVDLSALANLESEDGSLDMPRLLGEVRRAIAAVPRWEVLDRAYLGLFSFTKFLMWRDLQENRDDLMQSPVVRHLASQDLLAFRQQTEAVAPATLDDATPIPAVVDADATQLAAVASALAGRSFVLQGPPGTGKSQTITNMIAALLAAGKRVLFVSEKMAALEVVHRRLAEVGLADFVLELHDPETDKKKVLGALKRTYMRGTRPNEVPWEARHAELAAVRTQLNAVARHLHQPRPLGLTFHQAMARYLALAGEADVRLALAPAGAGAAGANAAPGPLDAERYHAMRTAGDDFAARAAAVEPVPAHPFAGTSPPPWSARQQDALAEALEQGPLACAAYAEAHAALTALLGLPFPDTVLALGTAARLAAALAAGPLPAAALTGAWEEPAARLQTYVRDRTALDAELAELGLRWPTPFLLQPAAPLAERLARLQARPWWWRWLAFRGERKRLKALARRYPGSDAALLQDLKKLATAQAEQARLEREAAWVRDALGEALSSHTPGPLSPGASPDPSLPGSSPGPSFPGPSFPGASPGPLFPGASPGVPDPGEAAAATRALTTLITRVLEASRACKALGLDASAHAHRWNTLPAATLASAAERAEVAAATLAAADQALLALMGTRTWPGPEQPGCAPSLAHKLARFHQAAPHYRAWCFYAEATRQLAALGLAPLARAHAEGRVPAARFSATLERNVLQAWLIAHRDQDPAFASFDGEEHERWIAKFRALDRAFVELSRRYVVASLETQLPHPQQEPLESSEPGILLKEESKSRKQLPLRKLFRAIPKLTRKLKPCFMMSPLSIARYLPADGERFDVVIFDEASQLATHDAVGAIARGNQVIVVGDSKQLPPTSFFQRKPGDDALPDENDLIELESVLEEAIARQMPEQMLGWHYRSQHDALIDFSNRHYYGGELMIFPAARRFVPGLGLKHHPVPAGVYHTGRSGQTPNTNPVEARALVEHLVEQLRTTAPGSRTFGVVTFSLAQQVLIRELLDEARALHPALEAHFTGPEGVFVKNLENVQGDERDEIYFSICYAADAQGKLRMNFGPLSLEGGERRLNVAITRARCLLRVFATLDPAQIDPERARATGARHLKQFLADVAHQGGQEALATARARIPSDGLAASVKAFLEARGHEVHAQVGCGDYRLELAVVDPAHPGQYALAVETDGAHYGSGQTARDRDRIRAQVLQTQGWRLTRVWGLDWWSNRAETERRLLATLQAALAGEPLPGEAGEITAPDHDTPEATPRLPATEIPPVIPYVVTPLPTLGTSVDDLHAPAAGPAIRKAVARVLETEAPIHMDLLVRRVMACYAVTRLTDAVRRRVLAETDQQPVDGFFQASTEVFRSGEREPEHWPPEETALALAWVLERSVSVPRQAAVQEVARLFGLKRAGKTTAAAVEQGLALLLARNQCRVQGDTLDWLS